MPKTKAQQTPNQKAMPQAVPENSMSLFRPQDILHSVKRNKNGSIPIWPQHGPTMGQTHFKGVGRFFHRRSFHIHPRAELLTTNHIKPSNRSHCQLPEGFFCMPGLTICHCYVAGCWGRVPAADILLGIDVTQ